MSLMLSTHYPPLDHTNLPSKFTAQKNPAKQQGLKQQLKKLTSFNEQYQPIDQHELV
jgi:hypothetical protein